MKSTQMVAPPDYLKTNTYGDLYLYRLDLLDWIKTHAPLYPLDLSGLDLSYMDLKELDLRDAKLVACDLTGADMRGAQLDGADLRDARLVPGKSSVSMAA